jgi:hypothetical protein
VDNGIEAGSSRCTQLHPEAPSSSSSGIAHARVEASGMANSREFTAAAAATAAVPSTSGSSKPLRILYPIINEAGEMEMTPKLHVVQYCSILAEKGMEAYAGADKAALLAFSRSQSSSVNLVNSPLGHHIKKEVGLGLDSFIAVLCWCILSVLP